MFSLLVSGCFVFTTCYFLVLLLLLLFLLCNCASTHSQFRLSRWRFVVVAVSNFPCTVKRVIICFDYIRVFILVKLLVFQTLTINYFVYFRLTLTRGFVYVFVLLFPCGCCCCSGRKKIKTLTVCFVWFRFVVWHLENWLNYFVLLLLRLLRVLRAVQKDLLTAVCLQWNFLYSLSLFTFALFRVAFRCCWIRRQNRER